MGWWRKADWLKSTLPILERITSPLIAESLGGSRYWIDRFVAHTGAFVYYWIIVLVYHHPGLLITSCSRWKNTRTTL